MNDYRIFTCNRDTFGFNSACVALFPCDSSWPYFQTGLSWNRVQLIDDAGLLGGQFSGERKDS